MKFFSKDAISKLNPLIYYVVIFLLVYARAVLTNDIDVDLFSRLLMGSHVAKFLHPAFHDIISYTPTHVWFDPEWATSAILYLIQTKFGIIGLTWAKVILVFTFFFLLPLFVKASNKEYPYNFGHYLIVFLIFAQAGYLTYTTRCQLFGFIFLLVWIFILEKIRNNDNRYLYIAPFLMLLWLNCHGGCIAGVGILVFYAIGEFLNKKPFIKYIYLLLVLVFVFMINPWGVDYIKFMFDSAFLDRSWIAEWQNSFMIFRPKKFYFMFYMLLCGFSYFYYCYKNKYDYSKIDKTKVILFFVLGWLSIKHVKHIGLSLALYPVFFYDAWYFTYNSFMDKLRRYLDIKEDSAKKLKIFKNIFLYMASIGYSIFIIAFNPVDKSYIKYFNAKYPFYEMEFLKANDIKGNILTQFEYGAYIGYKYYPDYKIFIDGRQEQLWEPSVLDELMFFLAQIGEKKNAAVEKYRPDIVIIDKAFDTQGDYLEKNGYIKVLSKYKSNVYILKKHSRFVYKLPKVKVDEYVETLFDTKIDFKEPIKK